MFKFYTLDERLTHVKSVYRKYSKIGGTRKTRFHGIRKN